MVMVGHNPGLEDWRPALSGVPVTLKTSTFAILHSGSAWESWKPGNGNARRGRRRPVDDVGGVPAAGPQPSPSATSTSSRLIPSRNKMVSR